MKNGISQPPSCNTGVQNTYGSYLIALVDWLQITFKNEKDPFKIVEILELKPEQFTYNESGMFGYHHHIRFDHIAIYYDGLDGMGCHLYLSGSACRQYESLNKLSWSDLFFYLLSRDDVNFSRLDLAIDDFSRYLDLDRMIKKIKNAECISKFKSARSMEKIRLDDGGDLGKTIYFGSGSSDIQIRFYDKKKERAGKDVDVIVDHWIRSEIQSRNRRANQIAMILAENGKVGDVVSGILRHYIRFVDRGTDQNRSRWKTSKWWDKFLGDVEPLRLTQKAPDLTIERSIRWIDRQVLPTLSMLDEVFPGDLDRWIKEGKKRFSDKHIFAIEEYKKKSAHEIADR